MTKVETRVTVTVGGVSRDVTAYSYAPLAATHALHVDGVVAIIGRGTARYPAEIMLYRVEGSGVHRGNATTADSVTGALWQYNLRTAVRNRQARIVAFADVAAPTNDADQTRR